MHGLLLAKDDSALQQVPPQLLKGLGQPTPRTTRALAIIPAAAAPHAKHVIGEQGVKLRGPREQARSLLDHLNTSGGFERHDMQLI
jgi:hypothetical protein